MIMSYVKIVTFERRKRKRKPTFTRQALCPSLGFFPKFSTSILVLFIKKFLPQHPLPRACGTKPVSRAGKIALSCPPR